MGLHAQVTSTHRWQIELFLNRALDPMVDMLFLMVNKHPDGEFKTALQQQSAALAKHNRLRTVQAYFSLPFSALCVLPIHLPTTNDSRCQEQSYRVAEAVRKDDVRYRCPPR